MKIQLPYGRGVLETEIPDARLQAVFHSRLDEYCPSLGEAELVRQAMASPIGSPTLRQLAQGKQKITIIASDHTRPVPSRIILPLMLEEIRQGNPQAEITILIATGCHRETTQAELEAKFGPEILAKEYIEIHDCNNEDSLVFLDTLPSGGRLIVNRTAAQADLLVAEGFIEPHFFAGYSGGRKSVFPGGASRISVHANHCSAFIAHPKARCGILDGNPIHRDMLFAAKRTGLAYIVNVVINSRKEVVAAFAGDCDAAHRQGTVFLDAICRSAPQPADIVLTSNNGYPLDQNIYQAVKGMTTAEATCRDGGVIILAAQCEDGIGGDSFYQLMRSTSSPQALLERFLALPPEETLPDQWQAQIFARILSHHPVVFISDVPDKVVEAFHMTPAHSIQEALSKADRLLGRNDGRIVVIPEGISNIIR